MDDRDLVGTLLRWEESGAVWRVVARTESRVTIALLRCDGGEELERLTTTHPATLAFVAGRDSSSGADGY